MARRLCGRSCRRLTRRRAASIPARPPSSSCRSTLRHRQLQPPASSSPGPSPSSSHNHFEISPLAFAAWRGDAARVAALLEQPSARQEVRVCLIGNSCDQSSLVQFDSLAPARQGPNLPETKMKWSACDQLHTQLKRAHLSTVLQLHLRDKEGWSVLHFAVRGGSPACIRLLAQAGADMHAVVPGGQQALHWAAAAASADCCAELLLAGAVPAAPDSAGRSAVQLAQRRLQHELFAEQQAPCQRPAGVLPEARKVLALLQAAAGGQLPFGGNSGGPDVDSAPPPPASEAAPETPQLGSRAASCRTLDDTASVAGSSAADGGSVSGRRSGGAGEARLSSTPPAAAAQAGLGGSPSGSPARRECRVCLQDGQELLALIPCGHRATCQSCTARLLLPGLMASLAAAAADGEAPGGGAGAGGGGEACRCPVCRAEVGRAWSRALAASCPSRLVTSGITGCAAIAGCVRPRALWAVHTKAGLPDSASAPSQNSLAQVTDSLRVFDC